VLAFFFFLPLPFPLFVGIFAFLPRSDVSIERKLIFHYYHFFLLSFSEDPPPFGDEWGFMCVKKEGKEADGSGRMQKAEILIFSKGNKITPRKCLAQMKTFD